MIASFRDKRTAALFEGESVRGFPPNLVRIARRKLRMIHAATELKDLRSPPGNRLEPLVGDRRGQHSIRINDQWRVCFRWASEGAHEVEVVDYH